jgi:uncharacterized protein (DUF924 family)
MNEAGEVLDYWFGAPGEAEHGAHREMWFRGGPEIDAEIAERFGALYEQAATGAFDHWRDEARACLALILVLDQFPRNMFRGTARAFATDGKAAGLARHAVERGHDRGLGLDSQQFYYLPLQHGEDLADQRRQVELFRAGAENERKEEHVGFAVQHLEIIERFGRFPHRNAILGRESTPDELQFLEDGGEDVLFGTQRNRDPE